MAMTKLLVHLPVPLKAKLDALKSQGYTASGYIRALLEKELASTTNTKGESRDGT
ncbi:MAG: hypothetical protein O2999_15005 [Nitrospirae bacterium]|nr:hypothetical protein [Nitrospirota bacterium]MDA1305569.1 hypothetical protein [Nitrospirota bacterium]